MNSKTFLMLIVCAFLQSCGGARNSDSACENMRTIGLSTASYDHIMHWWKQVARSPESLKAIGKKGGWFLNNSLAEKLDAKKLGLDDDWLLVNFYGAGVDYNEFEPKLVNVLLIGDGFGYVLLYKINASFDLKNERGIDLPGDLVPITESIYLSCQGPR